MKTCIKAWLSSKFGQIRPLVSMATDSVIIWKTVSPRFSRFLMGSVFIFTGNDDIHKSWDEFEIRADLTTNHRAAFKRLKKKMMFPFFSLCRNPIHFKFVGIEDMHNI